jgi:hypothetical protein
MMVVRHRTALNRLAGFIQRGGKVLHEESELALSLQRQRVSVELVALPVVR